MYIDKVDLSFVSNLSSEIAKIARSAGAYIGLCWQWRHGKWAVKETKLCRPVITLHSCFCLYALCRNWLST